MASRSRSGRAPCTAGGRVPPRRRGSWPPDLQTLRPRAAVRLEVGVGELAPRGRLRNRAPVRPRHGFRQRQEVRPHAQSRLVRGPRVRVRPLDGARARVEPRVRRRPRPRRRERHGPEAPAGRRPARPRRRSSRFPRLVPRRPRHGAPARREAPVPRRPSRARPRARFLRERRGDGPRVPVVRQEPAAEAVAVAGPDGGAGPQRGPRAVLHLTRAPAGRGPRPQARPELAGLAEVGVRVVGVRGSGRRAVEGRVHPLQFS